MNDKIKNTTPGNDDYRRRMVLQRIETLTGHAGPREPVGWVARCERCHRRIVRGLDAYLLASEVRLDPAPLSAVGEALAIIRRRHTWSLTLRGGSRLEIAPRYSWDITAVPAGGLDRGDVLTAHRCASPWPWSGPLAADSRIPRPPPFADMDEPPF
jgi:hypothetical protein